MAVTLFYPILDLKKFSTCIILFFFFFFSFPQSFISSTVRTDRRCYQHIIASVQFIYRMFFLCSSLFKEFMKFDMARYNDSEFFRSVRFCLMRSNNQKLHDDKSGELGG